MAGSFFTSRTVPSSVRSFAGGLNSNFNRLSLQDNELTDVQNVDYDVFGTAKKRNGYTALNTSAFNSGASWTSLHYLKTSSGTDFLMGTCGNKLAKMDSLDGTWDDITGSLTITAGDDNRFNWITFKDVAFGTNNVDVPIKWEAAGNGATWTTVTGLTKAKYVESWNNYVFLANVTISGTLHSTRVYWSCINTPETWNAADFNEIGFKDGEDIMGLKALGDRLVIFKESSIYNVFFTGSSDIPFAFHKSFSDVGTISGQSIQRVNNGLVFIATDGVYFYDGNNGIKMSDKITNTLEGFNDAKFLNIVSGYQERHNRYWATFAKSAATSDRVLTWDSFNNAFSVYKGIAANAITVFTVDGDEQIYFGDYSGYVYQADDASTANDDPANVATAIDAFFQTKWYDYGDLVNQKGVAQVVVYYECQSSGTMSLSYNYDLQDGDQFTHTFSMTCGGAAWDSAKWDTDTWARSGGNFSRRDLTGRGRVVAFKFSNSTLGESFQVHGIGTGVWLETPV